MTEEQGRTGDERERANDRDDVARLVRLAGQRRAVPRERRERARAAVRAHWEGELRRRSRRRYAWIAAGLTAAASLALIVTFRVFPVGSGAPMVTRAAADVELVAGPAWSRPADGARAELRVGDSVHAGTELTTQAGSGAALRLASGHSLRLDGATQVRLLERGLVALERGAVYIDSAGASATSPLEVRTPLGTVREIGTQFELRLDDAGLRVRLREGAVVLRLDDTTHEVRAGSEANVDASGTVTRRTIPSHGDEWSWIAGVTPMLDLEGRSARAFLDWMARERGWTLAFADTEVARAAADTVLRGAASGLTVDQALDAVLPTCRLSYRVERGVLLVAADPRAGASP